MNDDIRDELEGFVEAWRDDAALQRQDAGPSPAFAARAEVYDECADEIEAMLKRLAAHPADDGDGWRPIGTAPKDGTPVIGCDIEAKANPVQYVCWFLTDRWAFFHNPFDGTLITPVELSSKLEARP